MGVGYDMDMTRMTAILANGNQSVAQSPSLHSGVPLGRMLDVWIQCSRR